MLVEGGLTLRRPGTIIMVNTVSPASGSIDACFVLAVCKISEIDDASTL
jgi:hypothetical protein